MASTVSVRKEFVRVTCRYYDPVTFLSRSPNAVLPIILCVRFGNANTILFLGYRDGSNMRKYKLSPHHLPHPASLYHKHNMQHRHSPLHETGFGGHSRSSSHSVHRPPPVSRVESPKQLNLQHQSTPLARLSPSSELSQQMPRILTLQVSA